MQQLCGKQNVVRAVDTNVLIRFLTADDAKQAKQARDLIEAGDVFIGTTVVLETEWVLRSGYGFSVDQIVQGLRGLGGLAGVVLEEPAETAQALDWMSDGMDFADALHLARSSHCSAFATFDRKLAARAKRIGLPPIETL
jgi:predicted nucleic-acid-binding protein